MNEENTIPADTVSDVQCWQEVDGQQVVIDCPDGVLASSQKASQRMEICKACPSYKSLLYMCSECGCIMPAKTRINSSECPLGKW
jgi:hypothetical protein